MFGLKLRTASDQTLEIDRLSVLIDGVYAIILTLLVLELKIPEGLDEAHIYPALVANGPKFAAFGIAFSAASVGWTFTYLSHSIIKRSNFLHLVLTLAALMAAALIPFASAMMGSYPDSPWGYVPYCLDIAALCLFYTLDLLLCGRSLSSGTLDARIILTLWLSSATCMAVSLLGAFFISFWSPHATRWVVIVGSIIIWIDYFVLSRWIARATAEEAGAHG